jgi:predicted O-linked N-acetylglucosamine transferase (SPINDLY family)
MLRPHYPQGGSRQRLRLGYVSYSFGLGVRNGLMYNVFEAHDRARVEVFGFAIRPHDDGARIRP